MEIDKRFVVICFDKDDCIYFRKKFDNIVDAQFFMSEEIDKYCSSDTMYLFVVSLTEIMKLKGE